MATARFTIRGKVQGVFFRAGTRAQAQALGLRGWARNLPDGSVEVVACGDAHAIEVLAQWLEEGPPRARVDEVVREPDVPAVPEDVSFEVR